MAKMLEKTQEEMTKWHFVQICGSYIQQIDDVDEHIHQLDASKLKEEEDDTIIIIVKYAKRLLMSSLKCQPRCLKNYKHSQDKKNMKI
jgi:hypothetical protein